MHIFHCETAAIKVTPTMQALGDQPYRVQIIPNTPLLPVETLVVEETYPLNAAQEALDQYKEKYGIDPSETWNFAD